MLSVNLSESLSASARTRMSMCLNTRIYQEYERGRESSVEPDEEFEAGSCHMNDEVLLLRPETWW
jgi:hypothetical protein